MERETNFFKKAISMVVAAGLITGIANVSVYSATAMGPAKYSDGYALQAEYVSPSKAAEKTIKKPTSSKKNTKYAVELKDFITSFKKGEKAVLDVRNSKGATTITVTKEKNGSYGVIDKNINGGEKVVYTASQFKKLMKGEKIEITIKDAKTGKKIKEGVKYNKATVAGLLSLSTNSKEVLKKSVEIKVIKYTPTTESSVKNLAKKDISIINKLLKNKAISKLAKTWLTKAKTVIEGITKSNKHVYTKYSLLDDVLNSIKKISNAKCSALSLTKETVKGVFSSLKAVLKNDITYQIYNKYGEKGVNLINLFSEKTKLSQKEIYNIFLKNGITKDFINNNELTSLLFEETKTLKDTFAELDWWLVRCPKIGKSLQEMKKLSGK